MWRLGGSLVLALFLAGGCAKRPVRTPGAAGPAAGAVTAGTATSGEPSAPVPFTDRELANELRMPSAAVPRGDLSGPPGPGATPDTASPPPAEVVPQIRETARGVVVTLPSAHFAFWSADLDPPARLAVERIARVLSQPRALGRRIVVEGYADDVGTATYNLALSRRRAETVARELIARGLRRDRVTVAAFGETRPVAPNRNADGTDNPAGRAKNRRVETVIRS